MNNKIKLKAAYLHPSEDLSDHPELSIFRDAIQLANTLEIGTYCLYGEKEPQVKLLSISNSDGAFHQLFRKQHLINTIKDLDSLTFTQYSALISILTRKKGTFFQLENPIATEDAILAELTSQTFGWLLWSWQIMGLISYYLPIVEPNTFINQLHDDSKGAWRLLTETDTNSGGSLYDLMEKHSLGLQYNTPSYYFGEQLKQLIQQ